MKHDATSYLARKAAKEATLARRLARETKLRGL